MALIFNAPLLTASFVRCTRCQWLQKSDARECINCGQIQSIAELDQPTQTLQSDMVQLESTLPQRCDAAQLPSVFATLRALAAQSTESEMHKAGPLDEPWIARCGYRALLIFQKPDVLFERLRAMAIAAGPAHALRWVFADKGEWLLPSWASEGAPNTEPILVTHRFAGETVESLQQRLSAAPKVVLCARPTGEHRLSPWMYELLSALVPLQVGSRRTFVRELGVEKLHPMPRSMAALRELIAGCCVSTDESFQSELWSTVAEMARE